MGSASLLIVLFRLIIIGRIFPIRLLRNGSIIRKKNIPRYSWDMHIDSNNENRFYPYSD